MNNIEQNILDGYCSGECRKLEEKRNLKNNTVWYSTAFVRIINT